MHTVNTLIGGAVLAGVGYLVTSPLFNATPIGLDIAQLEYLEIEGKGYFRQQINSVSGDPVPAAWAVQITRVDENGVSEQLCAGRSSPERPGSYSGEVDTWSLDDWVGDDCPDVLQNGDVAEVSWSYTNNYETLATLGAKLVVEK